MRFSAPRLFCSLLVVLVLTSLALTVVADGVAPQEGTPSGDTKPPEAVLSGERLAADEQRLPATSVKEGMVDSGADSAAPIRRRMSPGGWESPDVISNRSQHLSTFSGSGGSKFSGDTNQPRGPVLILTSGETPSSSVSERLEAMRRASADPETPQHSSPSDNSLPGVLSVPRHPIAGRAGDSSSDKPSDDLPPTETDSPQSVPSLIAPQRSAAAPPSTLGPSGDGNIVLLSNTGPSISVAASGRPTIVVGKPAEYVVTVVNNGTVLADEITLDVGVPGWVEIANSQASGGTVRIDSDVQQRSIVKWQLRQLAPHNTERLMLTLTPRDSRAVALVVRWAIAPRDTTAQIQVQEPKLELTLTGPDDVLYGETKVYTITLSNPGTGDAENVVLNLLPVTPNTETAGGRKIGTLKAGARQSIDVELTAHQAGRLSIRAEALADGGLRAEGSQEVLVRRANLQVAAIGPPMKYSGTTAAYKVRLSNTGDAPAHDVVLSAILPAGANYISSTDGGKLDARQGQVSWQVGALRNGAVRIFDLNCLLSSPGDNRLDIRSEAAGDLSAARSVVTKVEALADLKLAVNDPPGAVPLGVDSQYEVRVVNRGSKAAQDIHIVGFFGPGVEPIAVQGWRGEVSTGQIAMEPIPRLNAGQELVIRIVARAQAPGTHRFRAELKCSDPETELSAEESTKYYGDPAGTSAQPVATLPIGQEQQTDPRR